MHFALRSVFGRNLAGPLEADAHVPAFSLVDGVLESKYIIMATKHIMHYPRPLWILVYRKM